MALGFRAFPEAPGRGGEGRGKNRGKIICGSRGVREEKPRGAPREEGREEEEEEEDGAVRTFVQTRECRHVWRATCNFRVDY